MQNLLEGGEVCGVCFYHWKACRRLVMESVLACRQIVEVRGIHYDQLQSQLEAFFTTGKVYEISSSQGYSHTAVENVSSTASDLSLSRL